MGRVYVYLMEGDKAISFAFREVSDFMNPDAKL